MTAFLMVSLILAFIVTTSCPSSARVLNSDESNLLEPLSS